MNCILSAVALVYTIRTGTLSLIWAGLAVLVHSLGYLGAQAWSLFFLGAGGQVLIELAVRGLVPAYRRDLPSTFILAAVLVGLGTSPLGVGPAADPGRYRRRNCAA